MGIDRSGPVIVFHDRAGIAELPQCSTERRVA